MSANKWKEQETCLYQPPPVKTAQHSKSQRVLALEWGALKTRIIKVVTATHAKWL